MSRENERMQIQSISYTRFDDIRRREDRVWAGFVFALLSETIRISSVFKRYKENVFRATIVFQAEMFVQA